MTTTSRLRGLFVCSTFPTPQQPNLGLVNAIQAEALSQSVDLRVLSPHFYFPLLKARRQSIQREVRGLAVEDRATLYLPGSRGSINGWLYSLWIRRTLTRICRDFAPHFLLTSFAFPDGVGVGRVARRLGLPHVSILRGTDIHTYCQMPTRWRAIVNSLHQSAIIVARSRALADIVIRAGILAGKVHVIYNGIDRSIFYPRDRQACAEALGILPHRRRILFVGNFSAVKNIPILLDAFQILISTGNDATDLVLVGSGNATHATRGAVNAAGFGDRVLFGGELPQSTVALWMGCSDLLCLPSRNEGVPNVLLEACACGLPVVASRVGGIPEIVTELTGILVEPESAAALAEGLMSGLAQTWDQKTILAHAAKFNWSENARQLSAVLDSAVQSRVR